MPWQRIDPRYYADHLKRPRPAAAVGAGGAMIVSVWYRDDSHLDQGELVIWLDDRQQVVAFQLSHAKWPHGKEHIAEWTAGGSLLIGEVDGGEGGGEQGMWHKMSPVVRRLAHPDAAILRGLLTYFIARSDVLPVTHRTTIGQVLGHAMEQRG